jgi:hypothetical protein
MSQLVSVKMSCFLLSTQPQGVYGPPVGKIAVIFVDDLNMPQVSPFLSLESHTPHTWSLHRTYKHTPSHCISHKNSLVYAPSSLGRSVLVADRRKRCMVLSLPSSC